jgi:hypothetical protein
MGICAAGGVVLFLALARPPSYEDFWSFSGVAIVVSAGAGLGASLGFLLLLLPARWKQFRSPKTPAPDFAVEVANPTAAASR